MNRAEATVEMTTIQTSSMIEELERNTAREMLSVALRAEADAYIEAAAD